MIDHIIFFGVLEYWSDILVCPPFGRIYPPSPVGAAYHKIVSSLPVFQKADKECYLIPVGKSKFHSEILKFDSEILKSHSEILKSHSDFLKFHCEILISTAGSMH